MSFVGAVPTPTHRGDRRLQENSSYDEIIGNSSSALHQHAGEPGRRCSTNSSAIEQVPASLNYLDLVFSGSNQGVTDDNA